MAEFEPQLVVYSCRFGWGYLSEEASLAVQIKNWIPVICSGKIDVKYIVGALEHGADGVLVLGCPEGDCHYQDGNQEAKKRIFLLQNLLCSFGIEPERVKLVLSLDPEGARIPGIVEQMQISLKKLGPLKVRKLELKESSSSGRTTMIGV
jgi:F420-non-reducing hydrogenase iron-sulfur subunit